MIICIIVDIPTLQQSFLEQIVNPIEKMGSRIFAISMILTMVLSGALNTIVFKFQNTLYVFEGPYYKPFFHPYIQTMIMFMGEFMALPVFLIKKMRNKQEYEERQRQAEKEGKILGMNRLYLFIPCIFDLISSTLLFLALNFVSASAYQMLRGGAIVTTFICSILFLKMKVQPHNIWGSSMAFLGIIIVGAINTIYSRSGGDQEGIGLQIMGYILIVGSLFTQGIFFTSEQKLMSKYYLQPLEIVGFQGLFGFLTYILIVLGLCYTPCPFGVDACVFTPNGIPYFQGWTQFMSQFINSPFLILLTIMSIFVTAFFNVSGVTITKHINALARVIADVSKTIVVWIIGIVITITLGSTYPNLYWQKLEPMIIIFQCLGFGFLVLGNLVYNQMVVLPWMRKKNQENQMFLDQDHKTEEVDSQNIM